MISRSSMVRRLWHLPCYRQCSKRFSASKAAEQRSKLQNEIQRLQHRLDDKKKSMPHDPSRSVSDAEAAAMYKELTESKPIQPKISTDYLEKLRFKFLDTRSSPELLAGPTAGTTQVAEDHHNSQADLSTTDQARSIVTVNDFEKLIYANALAKRPDQAEEALHLMEKYQCQPSVRCYNHLMDAYANAGDVEGAVDVFKRLKAAGLAPDLYSYSLTIKALALNDRLDDALVVFKKIKSFGMIPSQPMFSSLISGCLKADLFDQAWDLFDSMRLSYHQPDEVSYTMILHACAKQGEVERALNIFEDMIGNRLYPTDVTFNVLINACAKRPDYFKEAFGLFEQMQSVYGFDPDIVTYNTLLSGCARKKDLARARTILGAILDTASKRDTFKLEPQTFINLLWCYSTYKPPVTIEDVGAKISTEAKQDSEEGQEEQKTDQPAPLVPYTLLADELPDRPSRLLAEVDRILDYMAKDGIKVTASVLNQYLAVHVFQRQTDTCLRIYDTDFDRFGIKPDAFTFYYMLCYSFRHKDASVAWKVWEDYQDFLEQRLRQDHPSTSAAESMSEKKAHQLKLEKQQKLEGWTPNLRRRMAVTMANTLAKTSQGDLTQALRFLTMQFRPDGPLAAHKPTLLQLTAMNAKALEFEDTRAYRTIRQLCQPNSKTTKPHLMFKYQRVNG